MCRNIRTLHNFEPPASDEEIRDAALQYVRKLAGTRKPSHANQGIFDQAVEDIADATMRLVRGLVTSAPPRSREEEREKARARFAKRPVASA
jgi:hypothetical protein